MVGSAVAWWVARLSLSLAVCVICIFAVCGVVLFPAVGGPFTAVEGPATAFRSVVSVRVMAATLAAASSNIVRGVLDGSLLFFSAADPVVAGLAGALPVLVLRC
jgi:hypothetical protein